MKFINSIVLVACLFSINFATVFAQDTLDMPKHEGAVEVVEGKAIFKSRCTACHKFGGKLVGPDLTGVADRRSEEWLKKFIKDSKALIDAGDKVAVALYDEYNKILMPAHPDLSDADLGALIDYIKGGGMDDATAAQSSDPGLQDASIIAAAPMAAISPNDLTFKLIFWFSAILIVGMVMGGAYMINKFSK